MGKYSLCEELKGDYYGWKLKRRSPVAVDEAGHSRVYKVALYCRLNKTIMPIIISVLEIYGNASKCIKLY